MSDNQAMRTTRDQSPVRAEHLRSKASTLRVFLDAASGRVVVTAAVFALGLRLSVGEWSWADVVVLVSSLALVGLVEWCIHKYLLHAELDSWRMRVLRTGHGHREHHLDPGHVGWLLLGGRDAALFVALIAVGTATWTMPVALMLGASSVFATCLTGLTFAYTSLAHYEWTHLLVHTNYRPKSQYYARLARNHRLHHFRNEDYWLGVTSNLGDRVLRTLPERSEVPLSATARSLDGLVSSTERANR